MNPDRVTREIEARNFSLGYLEVLHAAQARVEIASVCESPIEAMLGGMLVTVLRHAASLSGRHFMVCPQDEQPKAPSNFLLLIPQYKWKRWRYDFAVKWSRFNLPNIFIECDGKDFHSTRAQIANDRRKDAEAERIKVRMLRFTGSAIYRDPVACVREIVKYV